MINLLIKEFAYNNQSHIVKPTENEFVGSHVINCKYITIKFKILIHIVIYYKIYKYSRICPSIKDKNLSPTDHK